MKTKPLTTTIAILLHAGCGRYSLQDFAREGNIVTVRQHDSGVDINTKQDRPRTADECLNIGGTALHIAKTE